MAKTKVSVTDVPALGANYLQTAQAAKAINAATPGVRTTEFYLSLAVMVCALVLTLADKINGDVGLGAITAAGVGYAVSRGLAKT